MQCLILLPLALLLQIFPQSVTSNPFFITPHFDPDLDVIGDAKFTSAGPFVTLTDPTKSSRTSGLLFRRSPFKFLAPNPTSFSTDFTFSIPPQGTDGIALIIVPIDFPSRLSNASFGLSQGTRFFGVEFDTMVNPDARDENNNHVGVDVCSLVSLKSCNLSSINLVLNSGLKLRSWVDYDITSKRLEVRVSGAWSGRPNDPLLAYEVDLGEMWKGEDVLMGLSSSGQNSAEATSVYSWRVRTRNVPKWLHSQPVDPLKLSDELKAANNNEHQTVTLCFGLIFALGFGALLTVFGLLFRAMMLSGGKETDVQPKCIVYHGEFTPFRYEKVNVVVDDNPVNAAKN
ncbi:hypothetical protein DM860_010775 [Cuscuta australis]|uniref:Legume lectin domain-containing protein n=1 Tax=Cuscuta australis TaxID=267555 RepID=A0A328E463_9ASTE|nr:hypothetical protein DM860_010775 [Cuscuta australis]